MNNWAFILLAFSSLFVIVDSVGTIPAFLAMTPNNTPDERARMARFACTVATGIVLFFALTGMAIFKVFGITMPAFQIAGGLVLLLSSLDMLRAKRSPLNETPVETEEGIEKDNIAITPLAIPMLSGPGAISTSIVLAGLSGS